jgi:tetratricopeptide (TPR) repeat protein
MARTILISVVNPVSTSNLSADAQLRDIENIIKKANHSNEFIIKKTIATRLSDLQEALEEHKPHIVHFGGHSKSEKGLVLENDNSQPQILTNQELLDLFTPFADEMECVFLNVCHSLTQAQVICQQIGYVIGMRDKVADRTAKKLAEIFYQRLGAGDDYPVAFAEARKAIAKMTNADVPVLLQQAELPPSFIVEGFKNQQVTLFIGPQCAESAGFLPQAALQEKILKELRPKFDKKDEKEVKNWLKKVKYKHIAEKAKRKFTNDYCYFIQETFNPDQRFKALQPPSYFAYLGNLPLKYIVTTNLDKLLEDSLPSHWESFTWQDKEDFAQILRHDHPLLLHLLGRADRFETVVYALYDYKRLLVKNEGTAARNFLLDIFRMTTVLFVGYELNDPILLWLKQFVFDKDFIPEWHILLTNPTIEQQQSAAKQQINVLRCSQVDDWFTALANALNINKQSKVLPDIEETKSGWTQINQKFLDKLPPVSHTTAQNYYRGHSVSWALVKAGYTVHRAVVAKILAKVPNEGLGAFLLTAAGGEGKSTILMQLAVALAKQGYNTFHCAKPEKQREVFAWFKKCGRKGKSKEKLKEKLAVLIDNADLLRNVPQILRLIVKSRYDTTCIILAARGNEWRNAYRNNPRDVESFSVGSLTKTEARGIAQKLLNCQLATVDVSAITERLLAKNNHFLLAAILMATHGEPLQNILANVIAHIAQWKDSEELLMALGCVVALESRKNKKGQHYFCTQRLFQAFMGGISKSEMQRLCHRLTGEVDLKLHYHYIETRHPMIAKTLFHILFAEENGFLNEMEIHERILQVAGRFSREEAKPNERTLLTILPLVYMAQNDYEKARALFKAATEAESQNAPTWQAWANMEKKQGNVGEVDQKYSARWLFNQGTVADSKYAPVWQGWALLEENQGNIDRAKEIAQQGLQHCPNTPDILYAFLRKIENKPNPEDDITTLINQGKCDQAAKPLQ